MCFCHSENITSGVADYAEKIILRYLRSVDPNTASMMVLYLILDNEKNWKYLEEYSNFPSVQYALHDGNVPGWRFCLDDKSQGAKSSVKVIIEPWR